MAQGSQTSSAAGSRAGTPVVYKEPSTLVKILKCKATFWISSILSVIAILVACKDFFPKVYCNGDRESPYCIRRLNVDEDVKGILETAQLQAGMTVADVNKLINKDLSDVELKHALEITSKNWTLVNGKIDRRLTPFEKKFYFGVMYTFVLSVSVASFVWRNK